MIIRNLAPEDVDVFWELRLEALRGFPEAFGSSYEEELHKMETSRRERYLESMIFRSPFILLWAPLNMIDWWAWLD